MPARERERESSVRATAPAGWHAPCAGRGDGIASELRFATFSVLQFWKDGDPILERARERGTEEETPRSASSTGEMSTAFVSSRWLERETSCHLEEGEHDVVDHFIRHARVVIRSAVSRGALVALVVLTIQKKFCP